VGGRDRGPDPKGRGGRALGHPDRPAPGIVPRLERPAPDPRRRHSGRDGGPPPRPGPGTRAGPAGVRAHEPPIQAGVRGPSVPAGRYFARALTGPPETVQRVWRTSGVGTGYSSLTRWSSASPNHSQTYTAVTAPANRLARAEW